MNRCLSFLQWCWESAQAVMNPCIRRLATGFPPTLRSVHFLDPSTDHPPAPIHLGNCHSLQGFYLLEFWTPFSTYQPLCFFLSGEKLCDALHVRNLDHLWAFSDHGLWALLEQYIHPFHHKHKTRCISLTHQGRCILKELQPFQATLYLDHNVTARAACHLYRCLTGTRTTSAGDAKKNEDAEDADRVVLLDFDLQETERAGDEPLWP